MSPASATIDLNADDKDLKRTLADGEKRVKKYGKTVGDTLTKADKKAGDSSEELGKTLRDTYDGAKGPQKGYTDRLRKSDELVDKAKEGTAKYRDELDKTGQSQKKAFGASTLDNLGKMALGYIGISQAIRLVTSAIADKQEMEQRSLDFTLSVADAQIQALRNLGAVSDEERGDFLSRMRTLSAETEPAGGLTTILLAASSGLSSSFGNVDATEDAIRAAVGIAPESAAEIEGLTKALLNLGKATGTLDAEENLGFLLGVSGQSAVTSPKLVAQNLVPAIIGVTGKGGTAQEAGAIVAALTQGMADDLGAISGTAAISLAGQLRDFLPEEDSFKFNKGVRELDVEGTGLAGALERIRFLQENPLAREEFLSKASFEQKAGTPIEQLLAGGDTTTAQALESALQNIPKAEDSAAIARDMIRGVNMPFEQRVAGGVRAQESTVEALEGTESGKRRAAEGLFSREALLEQLAAANMGFMDRTFRGIDHLVATQFATNKTVFERIVNQEIKELRHGQGFLAPTEEDIETADILERGLKNMEIPGAFGGGQVDEKDVFSLIRTTVVSEFDAIIGDARDKQFVADAKTREQDQRKLDVEGENLREQQETPAEKLEQEIARFARLFEAGSIDEDTRDRARDEANAPFDDPKTPEEFRGRLDRSLAAIGRLFDRGAITEETRDQAVGVAQNVFDELEANDFKQVEDTGFQARFEGITEAFTRISTAAASRSPEDRAVKAAERAAAANEAALVKAGEMAGLTKDEIGILIEIRDKPANPAIAG